MLILSIQATLISVILIFLVHHLLNFFKTTLTVPKTKDLVNLPSQKYEHMFNMLNNNNNNNNPSVNLQSYSLLPKVNSPTNNNNNNSTAINDLTLMNPYDLNNTNTLNNSNNNNLSNTSMKNELKNFLKKQMTPDDNFSSSSTSITSIDNFASF
jgi:hypothetical protein